MSSQSEPLVQEIVQQYQSKDYKGIIAKLNQVICCNDRYELSLLHLLTWPVPGEKDLESLSNYIYSHGVTHIYSIGCGTGLLEWLLSQVLLKQYKESDNVDLKRVDVTGVEVDFRWWKSPYAPPTFLDDFLFVGKDFAPQNPFGDFNDMALFCYFNNLNVFLDYLNAFLGSFVVLIGPISEVRWIRKCLKL